MAPFYIVLREGATDVAIEKRDTLNGAPNEPAPFMARHVAATPLYVACHVNGSVGAEGDPVKRLAPLAFTGLT